MQGHMKWSSAKSLTAQCCPPKVWVYKNLSMQLVLENTVYPDYIIIHFMPNLSMHAAKINSTTCPLLHIHLKIQKHTFTLPESIPTCICVNKGKYIVSSNWSISWWITVLLLWCIVAPLITSHHDTCGSWHCRLTARRLHLLTVSLSGFFSVLCPPPAVQKKSCKGNPETLVYL